MSEEDETPISCPKCDWVFKIPREVYNYIVTYEKDIRRDIGSIKKQIASLDQRYHDISKKSDKIERIVETNSITSLQRDMEINEIVNRINDSLWVGEPAEKYMIINLFNEFADIKNGLNSIKNTLKVKPIEDIEEIPKQSLFDKVKIGDDVTEKEGIKNWRVINKLPEVVCLRYSKDDDFSIDMRTSTKYFNQHFMELKE